MPIERTLVSQSAQSSAPTPKIDPRLLLDQVSDLNTDEQIETLEGIHRELVQQLSRAQV